MNIFACVFLLTLSNSATPWKSRKQCLKAESAQQARLGKKARLDESVGAAEEPAIKRTLSATAETGTTVEMMVLAGLAYLLTLKAMWQALN